MPKEAPPFRLLSNEEFDRLTSPEKVEYIKKATEYLASLLHGPGGNGSGMTYAGPERRRNQPGYEYTGPERRRAVP
ncbi:MAG TPA: hypothetical protein VK043_12895 [Burkholderiales bacterium]|nr:hypothetical protein [Burkholderiales bacterium]